MTLAHRNKILQLALFFSFIFTAFILLVGIVLLRTKTASLNLAESEKLVLQKILPNTLSLLKENSTLLVFQNVLFPFYAFAILLSVYFLFEKTYVIEISFFIFFTIFLGLEGLKLLIPFYDLWIHYPKLVLLISRLLYFSRLSSLFVLLTAAIFVINPFTRRITPVICAIMFLALALTSLTPFNTSVIMSNFLLENGMQSLSVFSFLFFSLLTALAYYSAGKTLNASEYTTASWSMLLLAFGYFLSVSSANILFFCLANISFVIGVSFYLRSIHSYNLWQ